MPKTGKHPQKGALNLAQLQNQNGLGDHMSGGFPQLCGNPPHAAFTLCEAESALYLHRSTLLDRLAHITQLLGCDLKNPDFCLTLGILLRAELQQKRIAQPKP